ncbi:DNA-binding protein [Natrinema versiforme]|uniref:DNA-binding protein n=2 Tax=Natrinema versiforme TaxID=88724 RepID=A0A4P8WH89_9EURY|nr:DNA-binding protein [Natrinema versiforme]
MLEYTFYIRHDGCWTETINETFPDVTATIIYSYRLLGSSITMIELNNVRGSAIDELVAWLDDHPVMTTAQLLQYDEASENAYVSLVGEYDDDTEPVLNVLLRNRCFPTVPATVADGREHWSVIVPTNEAVSQAHDELRNLGSITVDSLGAPELDGLLTGLIDIKQAVQRLSPRQREILARAIDRGYYDSPRACSIETLAETDSANASTVGNHLRRSEAKILEAVFPLLTDAGPTTGDATTDEYVSSRT